MSLVQCQIDELLGKDLPYIINSMLAYDLMMHRKRNGIKPELKDTCYGDSPVVEPAFELGPIFGRSLLNFLGLSADKSYSKIILKAFRDTDIRITCLGPGYNLCDVNHAIVQKDISSLLVMMKLADKSIAHMTTIKSQESEHAHLYPAKLATYQLMLEHVHGINKSKIWWTEQGPR